MGVDFEARATDAFFRSVRGEPFQGDSSPTLEAFVNSYRDGGWYPKDRLDRVVRQVGDVWLQEEYIKRDLGLSNRLLDESPQIGSDLRKRALLAELSLMQSMILKVRILWERWMNLIFYLETGEELDQRRPKRRSKKSYFFSQIDNFPNKCWLFLHRIKVVVNVHDDYWRTPETHRNSTLGRILRDGNPMGNQSVNDILNVLNATTSLWLRLNEIVSDGEPRGLSWSRGMKAESTVEAQDWLSACRTT